jgi:transcriptional regulator with XRE-family HTH domain
MHNSTGNAATMTRIKRVPIADVLAAVAGDTLPQKAKLIGCSKSLIYYWANGTLRPSVRSARRLAKVSGYSVEQIRGTRRVVYD